MKKREDGRYQVFITVGNENGKRIRKAFYGATLKEAREKAENYKKKKPSAVYSAVVEQYLDFIEIRLTESAYRTLKARLEYFKFGEVSDVSADDVQLQLNKLALRNPKTQKATAKRTLTRYLQALDNLFDYAIDKGYAERNPCKRVFVPQGSGIKERRTLTSAEREKIEQCPEAWIAVVLIYTGLRRGELTALLWSDINFDEKLLTVNKSYDFKAKALKPPKTKAGTRIVPIPDNIIPILQEHKKGRYVLGHLFTETDWQNLREQLQAVTGVSFQWHELRHTYASVLYSADVDVLTACALLGHADVETTMGIYTHLEEEKKKLSIDKLNAYIKSKTPTA